MLSFRQICEKLQNPVIQAGFLYNTGNLFLALTPFIDGQTLDSFGASLWDDFLARPLPALAGIIYFIGGAAFSRGQLIAGNRLDGLGTLLLSADLILQHQYIAAAVLLILHAGGKLVGSFPAFFTRRFANHSMGWVRHMLGRPELLSGYGPMASRIPAALDGLAHQNWLFASVCFLWFIADYRLTRVRGNGN